VTCQSLYFAGDMSSKDGRITPNIALHLLTILQQLIVTIQNHLRAKKTKKMMRIELMLCYGGGGLSVW
jgi:hypothetical protein